MSQREWIFGLSSVMIGCCSNVIFLELLVKECPDSAQLITFAQFLLVAFAGFLENLEVAPASVARGGLIPLPAVLPRLKPRSAPLKAWMSIVIMFFVVNLLNNLVFKYNISMPFHIIFRSGSLFLSMLLGIFYLKRSYLFNQSLGVALVTVGVIACTIGAASDVQQSASLSNSTVADSGTPAEPSSSFVGDENAFPELWRWSVGLSLLLGALVVSCFLGIMQENVYQKYGKVSQEGLFYIHSLSLPGFLFFTPQIVQQIQVFSSSPPLLVFGTELSLLGFVIPRLWVFLALNIISQYICIRGVYLLTSITTSVTVNLILSFRKFLSLTLSLIYFSNPFSLLQLIGSLLVFWGTILYSLPKKTTPVSADKEKKEN